MPSVLSFRHYRPYAVAIALLLISGTVALTVLRAAQADSTLLAVFKINQKPVEDAIAELLVPPENKVIETGRTKGDGTVMFVGLDDATTYRFTARRSGYRRTYRDSKPIQTLKLELIKKYGPEFVEP